VSYESETIERAAFEDVHEAATAELRTALGLANRTIGAALVSIAARLPPTSIYVNRTIGAGLAKPETEATVGDILAAYCKAGVGRFLVNVSPTAKPPELADWLAAAGLEKARAWQKFRRGREAVPKVATELRVAEIGAEHGEAFGRIAADAFDLGEGVVPWLARLPGRAGWHVFMSFDGDAPAGIGALFVRDGLATVEFGATAPAFRRRGSQGALMARRLERALDLGCREIFTCTGVAVPGDPQHSYRNILRMGFREDYVRDNWAPPRR
jgi:GNAT superfamily N-acetyltransferase